MIDHTTEIPNLLKTLNPTPLERAMGRFMRAPDHGAGDGDQGGGDGAARDAASAGADGGSDAGQSGGGDGQGDDDSSLLGGAGAEAGSGDGGQDGADGASGKKDGDDDAGKADGPPEAYDLKVTTKDEDGKDVAVEIDAPLLEAATPIFKELGLSNDQANKLAPLALQVQERVFTQQAEEFATLKADWAKQVHADKELGGAKWKETESLCARALDSLGFPSQIKEIDGKKVETNPFRVLLNTSGVGNHPEFIRAFRRIGERVSEDPASSPAPGGKTKIDRLEALYPDDVPEKSKQGV